MSNYSKKKKADDVVKKAVNAVPRMDFSPTRVNADLIKDRQNRNNRPVEYVTIKDIVEDESTSPRTLRDMIKSRDTSPRNYGTTNTNRWHLGLYDDEKTPDMTLGDYTYKPLLSGYYNQRMNEAIGKNRLSGNMDFDTPEIVKYQSLYEKSQPNQFNNPKAPFAGLLNKGIQGAMGLAGQRVADITDEDTVTYAGVGAATGAMAGSVVPLAGNVIGAGTGFSAGIATGVGKNMFESMFGSTYKGLVDAGVSDNTAYKTALMSAGMQSALEMAQVDELVKATKLLKKQGKTVLADGIEKMLLDRGKSIFTNSAEEVAQESVAMAGEYYAKSKENLPTDSWEDNVRRAGQTALESAISFGMFSLPGTISTGAQIYNHNNHINKQNTANDVMNEDSKVNAKEFISEFKSPQEFQSWAEKFADKANVDIEFVADENDSFNGYFSSYNESKNGRAGKIVVNINAKDPINTIFAHELTHALEINEAEYNDYANFAINNILSEHYGTNDITYLAELKASFYAEKGVNIDMDSAKKEIVAELTSEYVFKDEKAIESLFRYNESLFYRIFENIKSMIKRFTGTKEERNLIRARALYAKVLKANGKNYEEIQGYDYIDKEPIEMYNVDNKTDFENQSPLFGNSLMLEELEDDKTFNKALSTKNKSPDNVSDIDNETKSRYKENEKRTSGNMVAGSEEAAFSMQKKEDEKKFSLSKKALGDLARSLKREYGSKYAIKDIKSALNELYDMDENDDNLIDNKIQEIAKNVAQNVSSDLEYSERIKSFRDAVKDMPIKLDDSIKNDIPDFSSWAKKYFNRINFSKAGRAIDEYYQELAGAFPDFLDGDIINPADQIRSIADALDSSRSFNGDINVDDISYDVALRIYDDYYKHRAEDFNDGSNEVDSDDRESFFDKGENPVRDIDIESENEHGKNMRFTRTAAESGSLNDEQADSLRKQVESGRFTYNVINDADAVSKANDRLERSSVDRELSYLEGLLESKNLLSKDDIVLGERIIQEYAKAGDVDNLERAIAVVATAGTRAGQAVQAMRVLKKLSPEGQLMALQKQINIINTDMNLSGDKKVKLSPERVKDIKSSSSSKGLEQALERAKMELYDKVPSRWIDKWNAWRYLSMLGNPKTHIRNIIGNAIFVPVRELKNVIGASIENTVVKGEKSKAVGIVPKVFKEFAAKEFDENRRIIEAGGKENMERERRIFKSSILEGARKLNSWALESEDQFFLRSAYVRSFAGYLKANKVSPTLVKKLMSGKGTAIEIGDDSISKIVDNAREYAMNEAQKATYRDYSAMANALNALKKKNAVTNVIGEGLMPFTKTPANILKRGVEYSPIGILKGIKELTHDVKKADEESRQRVILKGIDSMASGLSGSGILMLGMFLASQGILSGSGEEDKKLRDFDNMQGSQNYSINLGDFSYTIDWLAPVSLPLFVGVELFDSLNDGSWGGFTNIIDSMTAISEPMINMSMLQGINRAVTNYEPDKALTNLITDASVGYLSQGVPTVMGQVARTIDDSRRSTYVDKNKDIPIFIQKALQQVMAKTPEVSKKLNPYRDSFGRVQGKDSVISRALENFVSPGYVKKKERDEVLDELKRVYDSTDDRRVLPAAPSKSFGDMNLSASEYDKVSEIKGNTAYDVISSMMNNSAYSNLDDTEKAKAISYAYDYAVAKAKDESLGTEPDGWIAKAYNAAREGIEPDVYIAYNAYKNSFDDSVNDSEKNRKTREVLFEDDSLSSSDKAVIDEYMFSDGIYIPKKLDVRYDNRELFEVTQEREADSKFYYKYEKYASKIGMDLKMYNNMYDIVYGNKTKGLKKGQKIRMMIDSGATERQANELYRIFYSSKYK